MPSKWCDVCQKIVCCSFVPNYCCWCGKDLTKEQILPKFGSYDERVKMIEQLKPGGAPVKTDKSGQVKLF